MGSGIFLSYIPDIITLYSKNYVLIVLLSGILSIFTAEYIKFLKESDWFLINLVQQVCKWEKTIIYKYILLKIIGLTYKSQVYNPKQFYLIW